MYLFARYYDPTIGRFYALDPELGSLSMPQTLNRYVYCANSPLIHTDPTGRFLNLIAGAVGAVVGGAIGGVITYVATGGDLQATGAAMLGGMVAGGLAGLTMGASLIPTVGAIGNAMAVGAIAGAAGGAAEQSLLAGAKSSWDAGKMAEGILKGAVIGRATGLISGGVATKFASATKLIPEGAGSYQYLLGRSQSFLAGVKTANYATKEGVVSGVNIMSKTTANRIGNVVAVSSLTAYDSIFSSSVGVGVSGFSDYYFNRVRNVWETGRDYTI